GVLCSGIVVHFVAESWRPLQRNIQEHSKTTNDGLYTIMPVGRLINVKIQKVVESGEYEELKQDLKEHYEGNPKVNDVYICQAGTIMIDCRN
ncbi:hypothetical protein, partial [Flavobacterium sp. GSP6]|uniref:hypothetical protein n=1 Tax=Flavobacterium sp. GSP6 TaxID=2497488 RepID=UPI0018F79F1F